MKEEERRPYAFTVDYNREREPGGGRPLLHRGLFWHNLPRLMPVCRLVGHRPVIDGTDPTYRGSSPSRWVVCDRCGVRTDPQGSLDPSCWNLGDPYTGPHPDDPPAFHEPGRFPARPAGHIGAEVVLGRSVTGTVGAEFKVGNGGSEHTLAANVRLGWLGSVYVHTERFGTGVQRRLNPVGYDSRVIGVQVGRWCGLEWRLWSRRDNNDNVREPWWMHGQINPRLTDRLLGRKVYAYADVPGAVCARVVKMPEADYLVELKLRREVHGRAKGRKKYGWSVDWKVLGRDIPYRDDHPWKGNGIYSSGVKVTTPAVHAGTWPAVAVAAVAVQITGMRTRHCYDPIGRIRVVDIPTPVPA